MSASHSAAVPVALPVAVVREITHLDPLPVTAMRLIAMLQGGDESLAGIAGTLENDQALVASVMRRANSARYAASSPRSVLEAVLRLGTLTLLDIVLDGHLRRLLTAAPTYGLSEHDLWQHAAASRLAVRALRAERPRLQLPPLAETAALLHDIGKLVAARYLKADASVLTARVRADHITYTEAERQVLGFDHTVIGAAIAEHWHFPEEVVAAIRYHHDVERMEGTPLLDAVQLANIVAKMVGAGLGVEGLNFNANRALPSRLGLDFAAFARVCLATQTALADVAG